MVSPKRFDKLGIFSPPGFQIPCSEIGVRGERPQRAGELGGAQPRFPIDFCNDPDGADTVVRSQALFI